MLCDTCVYTCQITKYAAFIFSDEYAFMHENAGWHWEHWVEAGTRSFQQLRRFCLWQM